MPDTPTRSSRIAQIAAALTAASLLMLAVGLLAAQTGLLAPVTSFMLFAVGTLLGGLLCGILGLIGVFLTRGGRDPLELFTEGGWTKIGFKNPIARPPSSAMRNPTF